MNTYSFVAGAGGTFQPTIRHSSPDSASDSIFWDIDDGAVVTQTFNPDDDSFHDQATATQITLTPGPHKLHLWMRENGQRIDHFQLESILEREPRLLRQLAVLVDVADRRCESPR